MDTDRIERETLIAAPLKRVWAVVTHPGVWVGEADPANFDLREGATYVFEMGDMKMPQRVEKIEPQRYISYRWAAMPWRGEEPREGNSTLVEFILTPEGDHTRLRVVESGFDALQTAEELRRKSFDDNTKGWAMALDDLKQRAEQPAA